MKTKPFAELDQRERSALFTFLEGFGPPPPFASPEEMARSLTSPAFNGGSTYLTLWAVGGDVVGTIGVITREATTKGEVFLTALYARRERADEVVAQALAAAYGVLRTAAGVTPATKVRLGVRDEVSYLQAAVERAGFRAAYRVLELSRPTAGPEETPRGPAGLRFVPVGEENLDDYVSVHNAAFVAAPNGAVITRFEAQEAVRAAASPSFVQVGYLDGVPVALVHMAIKGDVAQLDSLAVAPAYQGQGLGRAALAQALEFARRHRATEVRLQVVDSNARAVRLYLNSGFAVRRTVSVWFDGPPVR